MSRTLSSKVAEFHDRLGTKRKKVSDCPSIASNMVLMAVGEAVINESRHLVSLAEKCRALGDERVRVAMIALEELGELIEALGKRYEGGVRREIGDALFAVMGIAEATLNDGLACLDGVADSNLTRSFSDPSREGMRNKGDSYVEPKL